MLTIDYDQTPIKWELETVATLSKLLGDPHTSYPIIHVAGTNGKGSVCLKIAHGLNNAKIKVGLFTSPHLYKVNERIQINGKQISDKAFNEIQKEILRHKMKPSFFETLFLAATIYFQQQKVDVAVFEVGLGGRLDATNIVNPLLSIITSIGLDHTDILGKTTEAIAKEKGGIIKENVPLILGPNTHNILHTMAKEKNAPLYLVPPSDRENEEIAKKALELLDITPGDLSISPPCRLEQLEIDGVTMIFDVAHNPAAFAYLQKKLPYDQVTVAMGVSQEKDLEENLRVIKTFSNKIFLLPVQHPKLATIETGLSLKETIAQAISHAKMYKQPLLFTGSFYIMSAVKEALSLTH